MGSIHILERSQRVELPLEQAFEFYGDAHNLEAITPPWLGFAVTSAPAEMRAGARIEYRLKLHGVPVRWRTEIESWEPPHRFVDVQRSGPYALWEHTHFFEADGENATVLRDRVRYALPLGPLGDLAHRLFVRRDVERIFDYRHEAVAKRLAAAGPLAPPAAPRAEDALELNPIGVVESPLRDAAAAPKQGDEGAPEAWLAIEPRFAEALVGIEAGAALLVLTWLDRAPRGVLSVHPRGDVSRPQQGVFATRSPARPNPIGLHRVEVVEIDGTRLRVRDLEALDGTPVLDLKPVLSADVESR